MDKYQQAAQFWAVLVLAARSQQLLSYSILEQATGVQKRQQRHALRLIGDYCKSRRWPKLTSIVVGKRTGVPAYKTDKLAAVSRKHVQVFEFTWLRRKAPLPKDFERRSAR